MIFKTTVPFLVAATLMLTIPHDAMSQPADQKIPEEMIRRFVKDDCSATLAWMNSPPANPQDTQAAMQHTMSKMMAGITLLGLTMAKHSDAMLGNGAMPDLVNLCQSNPNDTLRDLLMK